jgi:hypothetical protein
MIFPKNPAIHFSFLLSLIVLSIFVYDCAIHFSASGRLRFFIFCWIPSLAALFVVVGIVSSAFGCFVSLYASSSFSSVLSISGFCESSPFFSSRFFDLIGTYSFGALTDPPSHISTLFFSIFTMIE